jgi:hypothetical protein
MSVDDVVDCGDEFLTDEELASDPDVRNGAGVILCDRMWTMCTVPGMWIYAEGVCSECGGYNTSCEIYRPMILE